MTGAVGIWLNRKEWSMKNDYDENKGNDKDDPDNVKKDVRYDKNHCVEQFANL